MGNGARFLGLRGDILDLLRHFGRDSRLFAQGTVDIADQFSDALRHLAQTGNRIAGLARVASTTRADPTQFDPASPYFDAKSPTDKPRWLLLDVQAQRKTPLISLAELRAAPELADMRVLQRGNRLSITPVTADEWQHIQAMV